MSGRILSGDQFIEDAHLPHFAYLKDELKGRVVEMEGAAVATVCHFNKIDFLIIRTVSDNADGSAAQAFTSFLPRATQNSLTVIKEILRNL